jgi:hypothetical protein
MRATSSSRGTDRISSNHPSERPSMMPNSARPRPPPAAGAGRRPALSSWRPGGRPGAAPGGPGRRRGSRRRCRNGRWPGGSGPGRAGRLLRSARCRSAPGPSRARASSSIPALESRPVATVEVGPGGALGNGRHAVHPGISARQTECCDARPAAAPRPFSPIAARERMTQDGRRVRLSLIAMAWGGDDDRTGRRAGCVCGGPWIPAGVGR